MKITLKFIVPSKLLLEVKQKSISGTERLKKSINAVSIITLLGGFTFAHAANFPQGLYPIGEINTTLTQSGASGITGASGATPDNWAIAENNTLSTKIIPTKIDQYYGHQIQAGVLLVFYDGSITGPAYYTATPETISGTWDSTGTFTVSPSSKQLGGGWAASYYANNGITRPYNAAGNGSVTTLNAKYGLYISAAASATVSSVTIPELYIKKYVAGIPSPYTNYKLFLSSRTIIAPAVTDCTVSLQNQTVDFGQVQQKSSDSQILGVFPSQLSVNCSKINDGGSGTETAAMMLSFTGTQGRYTDTLALKGTKEQGNLAEVRGVHGTGAGSCDNNPDRIQFQGQQYSVGNLGLGQTNIPLTWTLCSNGSGLKGVGSAQATATLTWP